MSDNRLRIQYPKPDHDETSRQRSGRPVGREALVTGDQGVA
jgi:hypothetical protein